ncbi:hypothetical protein AAE02nite_24280 [Adhaeribacter aerolatus]|uniref:Lipoprotein n=1 Tax=Adhaeribacter aerolatus TaxID=670289 RepID=A0A512AYI5_9BACT|nr:hypothetical protein [Adhaeribacter aerolatus]GEO04764.1 hypothetical protein AAE02nite_24280 [Adhaeribacter aerolatus]
MKQVIGLSLAVLILIVGCSENKELKEETNSLVDTLNGHTYLALWKSKYYPRNWKSFDQLDKPFGIITVDTINNINLINVKFWLADSALRQVADKENISYTKTYFLDTTYKKELSNTDKWFKVKKVLNDTAFFQLKVNELKQTQEELRKKYSLKINCHFEDKNGIDYDTTFYSKFNAGWMQ